MILRITRAFQIFIFVVLLAAALPYSSPPITDQIERIRAFTRRIEFDYISWTIDAALTKFRAVSVGLPYNLDPIAQKKIVTDYLLVTRQIIEGENLLESIYADVAIIDKETATASLTAELDSLDKRQAGLAPLAEAILQEQVSQILAELRLTSMGQPIPNVLYHASSLPLALIVSERARIEQIANISVDTTMDIDDQDALENNVDKALNVSSLVVEIGGVGVYPTMVMRTTDLHWLVETISHEWTHNYLTLRPLGLLYDASPELRTMNETAASISGTEVGELVIERFYPELTSARAMELASTPFAGFSPVSFNSEHPDPGDIPRPIFDFRAEMHETRVSTDTLLAEGKIVEAEHYMEKRRLVFLEHGYLLRKVNQAYFSFYGAYADIPGGAAGADPVGPAVRELREQSGSLTRFINRISWMTDYQQLVEAIK